MVYGDSAYGTGTNLAWLDHHGLTPMVKTQLPTAPGGRFAKGQFRIDLQAGTVTCPARVTTPILSASRGGGRARFGAACSVCPLRQACTSSVGGRVVAIHPRKPSWPPPGPANATPPGWPTTGPPGPRSSASSPSCCAAVTAAGAPGCGAWSQVVFRGVAGDRRHGLSAQDAVSWATSWVPVVADGSGWSVAMTRAREVSDR